MANDTKRLGDLMLTVGTYKDASGIIKGRSLNIGGIFVSNGRLWATIQAHLLPFQITNGNGRAMEQLGIKRDKLVNHEIQISFLADKGKPITADILAGYLAGGSSAEGDSSSSTELGGSEDGIDF